MGASLLVLLSLLSASARATRVHLKTEGPVVAPRRHLQSTLKSIAVVTTGGTIASIKGPDGTLLPAANGDQLVSAVVGLNTTAKVISITAAAKIDSSEATPEFWGKVASTVMAQLKNSSVDAVLLLHGTDTLEQTAWFLQCIKGVGDQNKPVVMTGAMRGADSAWPDGPGNILAAATVAVDDGAKGLGVMVVMQDQVFSSRFVTKVQANLLDAFGSINGGSKIANVIGGKVLWYSKPKGKALCNGGFSLPAALLNVSLQSAFPGGDGDVIQHLYDKGYSGVVIQGLGSGNIGAGLASAVRPLANTTTFKIVITRVTPTGITEPSYGCPGCLGALIEDGVVQAFNLDGFKARIVLMLALSNKPTTSKTTLQTIYQRISYP